MFWQLFFYAGGVGLFLLVALFLKKEDIED
jgi:hypothetical protein